jgi:hypothetical protein
MEWARKLGRGSFSCGAREKKFGAREKKSGAKRRSPARREEDGCIPPSSSRFTFPLQDEQIVCMHSAAVSGVYPARLCLA